MVETNYTEAIKNINRGLSNLNYAKKQNIEKDIENAQKQISDASLLLLKDKDEASKCIKDHYNNVVYDFVANGGQGITKYLKHSLIREIIQNIIDCDYENNIRIEVTFDNKDKAITFNYNENGFKISNLISFFSLDHTSKDSNNTGAFGIGAKGAILSAKSITVTSAFSKDKEVSVKTHFEIRHIEQSGKNTLYIEELELTNCNDSEKGTRFTLFLDDTIYYEIRENLLDITGEKNNKGKYLTPIDLAFASLKKPDKEIFLIINNEHNYKVKYQGDQTTFLYNGGGVNFKVYIGKKSNFSYLIPYSRVELKHMPKYIEEFSYNYFSTYELTGALDNPNLPKFYINIPTIDKMCESDIDTLYYITSDRKGIQENKKAVVENYILEDFRRISDEFSNQLLIYTDKSYRYILRFLHEFLEYKLESSEYKNKWMNNGRVFYQKILISHENVIYKLADIKKYEFDITYYAAAKEIQDSSFLFIEKNCGFRRTKFKFIVNFRFVFKGIALEQIAHSSNADDEYMPTHVCDEPTYLLSDKYKKSSLFDRILYALDFRCGNEILLLSAEKDKDFTESTLLKLLKAMQQDDKITKDFNIKNKTLTVGDKEYYFDNNFKITNKDILYYSYKVKLKEDVFFEFIRELYLSGLLGKNKNELSSLDKIKKYKRNEFTFTFNHSKNGLINVIYTHSYQYTTVDIPIEDNLDISHIDYSELVNLTDETNYTLLTDKPFEEFLLEQNIIDKYGFDIEKINKFIDDKNVQRGVSNILNKIVLCSTKLNLGGKDLVAFIKDKKITKIIQFDNVSNNDIDICSDFIAIIPRKNKDKKHAKVNIVKVSKLLDKLLSTGEIIQKLYKPVDTPIVRMIDQFDARLKPILPISKEEIVALTQYLKKIDIRNKMFFAKDLNNKLYGYSTSCCVCNYNSDILNAFQVKSEIKYNENQKTYNITLYLCANHYFESEGWIISDVKFRNEKKEYTISFKEWIKSIKENENISANLLKCEIKIIKKSTYKTFSFDNNEDEMQGIEVEKYNIVLTPLMAIKWYSDNSNI